MPCQYLMTSYDIPLERRRGERQKKLINGAARQGKGAGRHVTPGCVSRPYLPSLPDRLGSAVCTP